MSGMMTISYFSEETVIPIKSRRPRRDENLISEARYLRSFTKHVAARNWRKGVKYLKKLSRSNMLPIAIARAGFVVADTGECSRKELINRVIGQINERQKIKWLKDVSYDDYLNLIANAICKQLRCDSLVAYALVKKYSHRINRAWVQGRKPDHAAAWLVKRA